MDILPEKVKARTTNWYVYPRTEKKHMYIIKKIQASVKEVQQIIIAF